MKADLIDLELMIHHQTAAAVLVSNDGDPKKAVWLPKAPVEFDEPIRIGKAQIVTMPQHLAEQRGLV